MKQATAFLTPSSFAALMTRGQGSGAMGKMALSVVDGLVLELLGAERRMAYPDETGGNLLPMPCSWGREQEGGAICQYEGYTNRKVRQDVFSTSRTHPYIGGRMDGLVGLSGGVEVKCPYNQREHLHNLLYGKQVEQYHYQMQGYLLIKELEWIDFISFSPLLPEAYQLFVRRVYRDEPAIEALVARCELAYDMAQERVDGIIRRYGRGRRWGGEASGMRENPIWTCKAAIF